MPCWLNNDEVFAEWDPQVDPDVFRAAILMRSLLRCQQAGLTIREHPDCQPRTIDGAPWTPGDEGGTTPPDANRDTKP